MLNKLKIVQLGEVDSTNSYALRNLSSLDDKTIIIAETQTSGRGRFERKWISDVPNNVYLSIVLKPSGENIPYSNITQYACLVLTRVFEKYKIDARIKWPNDILVDNKKISGILSEMSYGCSTVRGFVLGIGVNLNLSEELVNSINQPATALNLLIKNDVDKIEFVNLFLEEFFKSYDEFLVSGFSSIKNEYEQKSLFIGKNIEINNINGIARGVTADGELIVVDKNNVEHIVLAGDLLMI